MVIKLKITSGMSFIKLILNRIKLQREVFIIEIEQGNQVLVPPYLSQDSLPCSFRYYDPIIRIIQDNISQ